MKPELQRELVRALESAAGIGPLVLVFSVGQVAGVDKSVPAFWMEVTARLAPKLCAMAIASRSMVVRTAARGFSVANTLRRVKMEVAAFEHDEEALVWARQRLDGRAQPSSAASAR